MRNLIAILCLISSVALGYPAGPPNSVVRVPPAGGPVTTGAVDITKSAAVTGLSATAIPFWSGVGALGLQNTNCTYNTGTGALTCGGPITLSTLTMGVTTTDSSGNLIKSNAFVIGTAPTSLVACTTSPCPANIYPSDGTAGVVSVNRTGVGAYVVNFVASFWSAAPTCLGISGGVGTSGFPGICNTVTGTGLPNTTQYRFQCARASNGAAHDDAFFVLCEGPR